MTWARKSHVSWSFTSRIQRLSFLHFSCFGSSFSLAIRFKLFTGPLYKYSITRQRRCWESSRWRPIENPHPTATRSEARLIQLYTSSAELLNSTYSFSMFCPPPPFFSDNDDCPPHFGCMIACALWRVELNNGPHLMCRCDFEMSLNLVIFGFDQIEIARAFLRAQHPLRPLCGRLGRLSRDFPRIVGQLPRMSQRPALQRRWRPGKSQGARKERQRIIRIDGRCPGTVLNLSSSHVCIELEYT